jgi:hypothetical protein
MSEIFTYILLLFLIGLALAAVIERTIAHKRRLKWWRSLKIGDKIMVTVYSLSDERHVEAWVVEFLDNFSVEVEYNTFSKDYLRAQDPSFLFPTQHKFRDCYKPLN